MANEKKMKETLFACLANAIHGEQSKAPIRHLKAAFPNRRVSCGERETIRGESVYVCLSALCQGSTVGPLTTGDICLCGRHCHC